MKTAAMLLALAVPLGASAQGFLNEERANCYSWNGGNHSSGSFIECKTLKPAPAKPIPVAAPAPLAAPVSQVCPPQITVIPEPRKPKPIIRKKPKPVIC